MGQPYLGDFEEDSTLHMMWSTRATTGASITRTDNGTVSVYKDNGVAQSTAGITDTEDFDSLTGIHALTIVLTNAFYAIGADYTIVLSGATIDGVTVNEVLGYFSIENRGVAGANAVWDRSLTGATHNVATSAGRRLRTLQDFGLYEGGAVWIDTVSGTAGTTDFENGVVNNPVDNIADARTIADSVGLKVFHCLPGSTFTLAAAFDDFEFIGFDFTVAFGGQSIDQTLFQGGSVSGTYSGTPTFLSCTVNAITGSSANIHDCGIVSSITCNGAGDWFIHDSFSKVAGTGAPSFDFGAAVANTDIHFRAYSGGIEFKNMGAAGVDTGSIEGWGQVIFNANCAGGTLAIRGHFTLTDNAGGAVTVSDDARFDVAQVRAEVVAALITDLYAESAGVPAATASIKDKLNWIATVMRNKATQTATTKTIRNDGDSGDIASATISDDAVTFTRGKYI